MTGGEIIGMFSIAFFIFGSIIAFIIYVTTRALRGDEAAKEALRRSGATMNKQLKGYRKNFKDGYDNGRNRSVGILSSLIPMASAVDVETKFSDGLGQVLDGVWTIASPYVAVFIVLFIIVVAAKKFAGRQR
ncbi:hypothetical protein B5P43_18525 [Bacillus sp. SRB_336]|nr:hypothetical protein B5P43_18525 [Bacillus sp. SRB_336]